MAVSSLSQTARLQIPRSPSTLTNIKFFRSRKHIIFFVLAAMTNSRIFAVHGHTFQLFNATWPFTVMTWNWRHWFCTQLVALHFLYYKISTTQTVFHILCHLFNIHSLQEDKSSPFWAVADKVTHLGSLFSTSSFCQEKKNLKIKPLDCQQL